MNVTIQISSRDLVGLTPYRPMAYHLPGILDTKEVNIHQGMDLLQVTHQIICVVLLQGIHHKIKKEVHKVSHHQGIHSNNEVRLVLCLGQTMHRLIHMLGLDLTHSRELHRCKASMEEGQALWDRMVDHPCSNNKMGSSNNNSSNKAGQVRISLHNSSNLGHSIQQIILVGISKANEEEKRQRKLELREVKPIKVRGEGRWEV